MDHRRGAEDAVKEQMLRGECDVVEDSIRRSNMCLVFSGDSASLRWTLSSPVGQVVAVADHEGGSDGQETGGAEEGAAGGAGAGEKAQDSPVGADQRRGGKECDRGHNRQVQRRVEHPIQHVIDYRPYVRKTATLAHTAENTADLGSAINY